MNNEFNSVTAIYHEHDQYIIRATVDGKYLLLPRVSARTLEPLDGCTKGDEIQIEVQSWVLIDAELEHLIKSTESHE